MKKDWFYFPEFKTLQLGPYGSLEHGKCGCLQAKRSEVTKNLARAGVDYEERSKFSLAVSVAGCGLTGGMTPNTTPNRKKAYRILEDEFRKHFPDWVLP